MTTMLVGLSYAQIGAAVGAFVLSTLLSTGIVCLFLVRIRPDYFIATHRGVSHKLWSPVAQAFYVAGKNVLGAILVVVGVVLSLPGVPGQGLLTIFVGLLLMDIPGKRRLELKILRRDLIRRNIDRLRKRFGRAPLVIEPDAAQHPEMVDS